MGNVHMEAAQINYRGGEKKMSVEEALKTTSGEAAAIAQLQQDVTGLNTVKANKADIATEFSDLTNYNAGDLVYYEGALYEFQTDHTAGAWETSEVIQKDLSDIVTTLKSGLTRYVEVTYTTEANAGVSPFGFYGMVTIPYTDIPSTANITSIVFVDGGSAVYGVATARTSTGQSNWGIYVFTGKEVVNGTLRVGYVE